MTVFMVALMLMSLWMARVCHKSGLGFISHMSAFAAGGCLFAALLVI